MPKYYEGETVNGLKIAFKITNRAQFQIEHCDSEDTKDNLNCLLKEYNIIEEDDYLDKIYDQLDEVQIREKYDNISQCW